MECKKIERIIKIVQTLNPSPAEGRAVMQAIQRLEKIRRAALSQTEINVLISLAAAIKVENLPVKVRRKQNV